MVLFIEVEAAGLLADDNTGRKGESNREIIDRISLGDLEVVVIKRLWGGSLETRRLSFTRELYCLFNGRGRYIWH